MDEDHSTFERLRELIVRGQLPPQKRMVEAELAERLGVSRTPIREALGRLRNEEYVRDTGRGARTLLEVRPLSRADVEEIWSLLGLLEAAAIRSTARLSEEERTDLVTRLREVNRALEAEGRMADRSPDRLMDLQSGFHRTLLDRAGGPWLRRVYAFLRPHAERYEWIYGSLKESDFSTSVTEHDLVIDHIAAGRTEEAAREMADHWDRARERTGDLIARYWG